jgi:hypothetical protein
MAVAVALAGGAATTFAAAPAAAAAVPGYAPPVHRDAGESAGNPLDLRAAGFGQVGTRLSLRLRTREAWAEGASAEDSLCVTLLRRRSLGELCVAAGRPIARYRRAGSGRFRNVRGARVRRRGRVLRVLVYPHALGLDRGRLRWIVRSESGAGSCGNDCADRLPDTGSLRARVSAYGAPRCFGAAARARRSCVNRALRRSVVPKPGAAALMPDQLCRPVRRARRYAPALPCVFGARYADGPPRLALIGDSHSAHLRATAEVAAQARGWKAVSITHPGCAFSTEVYPAPAPIPQRCRRHSRKALRWLRAHRSVRFVVTSASAGRGLGEGGFRAMWSRVPRSVRRIYVVRDIPRVSYTTASCVAAVRRRHAISRRACAVSRGGAFPADPAAAAARHSGRRVRLIDFTRFFCNRARCFPVVGGAYVYRDFNHMNPVFAATLGPYLLRAMRARR